MKLQGSIQYRVTAIVLVMGGTGYWTLDIGYWMMESRKKGEKKEDEEE